MATAQLQLISTDHAWKLDKRTLEVGRAGVAKARAALASAHTVENPLDASYAEAKAATYQTSDLRAAGTKTRQHKANDPATQAQNPLVEQQQIVLAA